MNVSNDCPARIIVRDGGLWFVGNDAAIILELGNPCSCIVRLNAGEKGVHTVDTLRRTENDPGDLRSAVIGLASAIIAVQAKMVLPLKRVCRNVSPLKENENNSITTNDGIPKKSARQSPKDLLRTRKKVLPKSRKSSNELKLYCNGVAKRYPIIDDHGSNGIPSVR